MQGHEGVGFGGSGERSGDMCALPGLPSSFHPLHWRMRRLAGLRGSAAAPLILE